jgi:two-component system chemotaxis sensor kinase CheA
MIEDEELCALFKAESEEHLQSLDDGLLRLEANPTDSDTLEEVFRSAHSLKGAARMLGVSGVETVAHRFEDELGAARRGQTVLGPEMVDRLYRGVDAIRKLVREAVTGEQAGVDVDLVMAQLRGEAPMEAMSTPAPDGGQAAGPDSEAAASLADVAGETAPPAREAPADAPATAVPAPGPAGAAKIEDEELCALFKAESEEHLQTLDDGLLRLEANPTDSDTLEEVFRSAHSLKGAARMLGVSGVETVAHRFEDELGAARRGQAVLGPEMVDRLYRGLDAIRKLVQEAVTGELAGVDVDLVMAQLRGEAPMEVLPTPALAAHEIRGTQGDGAAVADRPPASISAPAPAPAPSLPAAPSVQVRPLVPDDGDGVPATAPAVPAVDIPNLAGVVPAEAGPRAAPAAFKIETIRVEPQKLDALMTMAGELTVTTNRVARGMAGFHDLTALWEEWSKDAAANRALLAEAVNSLDGPGKKFGAFHEREQARLERLGQLLDALRQTTYQDVTRLDFIADELQSAIQNVRLLPLSTVFNLFPRQVRDLARAQSKEVQLVVEGGETCADKRILEDIKDPLMHMVRNSVDHGVESPDEREQSGKPRLATVRLRAYQTATNVVIEIADDGRGLNLEAIKRTALKRKVCAEDDLAAMTVEQVQMLIFAPGFSTSPIVTDVSGRGVGMDVVHANVERLKGAIQLESTPGAGSTFRIRLPITLATTRVLLLRVEEETYALPVDSVESAILVSEREVFRIESRETICMDGEPLSVARLADLLELPVRTAASAGRPDRLAPGEKRLPCIILSVEPYRLGVFVDALLDEQEVIMKPLGGMLKRVRNVSGSTILGTGAVCMVLNAQDLIKSAQKRQAPAAVEASTFEEQRKQVVLLVEDSITTRTQEKRIIESAGYEVVTAVDGIDALAKLSTRSFDAIVSDIQMPNLGGLDFTARVRQDPRYRDLPVILVTSLASDEDRKRGIEVGADAYITKSTFEQKVLLDTLRRLV